MFSLFAMFCLGLMAVFGKFYPSRGEVMSENERVAQLLVAHGLASQTQETRLGVAQGILKLPVSGSDPLVCILRGDENHAAI